MIKKKADRAPRAHLEIKEFKKKGLILVNTGDGKGKTTAAFGTALRAIGRGYRVAMVQFIKGKWKTGEVEAARKLGNQFKIFTMGEGFTWDTQDYKRDVETARKAWAKCRELLFDDQHELVIFDEINYCMQYNFLDPKEVVEALKKKPPLKHVILTGGGAPAELVEIADLVTEMRCVKHPYQKGIKAQPGIEY
ncbi:MAG TPA: cob(I)yrinic acid a,c-diamide adenosyltransferase [bacterium]|nr:cob(I)yrinic acid a,c-diamide adenosyltransferase [bacterium]